MSAGISDVRQLLPRDKCDTGRAELLVRTGYPAIAPILPELTEWLQDINWPVAHVLAPFLASIGTPLLPHIRHVLMTDDQLWKYRVLSGLVEGDPEMACDLGPELSALASAPDPDEDAEPVCRIARKILAGRNG